MPPILSSLRSSSSLHRLRAYLSLGFRSSCGIAALTIFFHDNIATSVPIVGNSMRPTLSPNYADKGERDTILLKVWNCQEGLKRGDVAHFMSPNHPNDFAVKRVIALPGDTVILDKRRRPSSKEGPEPIAAQAWDSWRGRAVVPPGHVWVEGDNWRETSDSNWYGPVSKSMMTGKAVMVWWPWSRAGTRPWEGWKGRTRVIEGTGEEGLGELAEVGFGKG